MGPWSVRRVLLVTAAANLLLLAALFSLRSPVRAAPEQVARPELPSQVGQLNSAIKAGLHGEPFSLLLSEADLTALAGYALASNNDLPFARPRVSVVGQKVVIDGVTRGLALTLPVRVTGTAGARNGVPWARVEDVSLGDTQVPGFIRDQVVQQANLGLDLSRYNLGITVERVQLSTGSATVTGTIR